ncbi:MAG: hypothetical protein WDO17_15350 [Alphaproteobacteria bacterium]
MRGEQIADREKPLERVVDEALPPGSIGAIELRQVLHHQVIFQAVPARDADLVEDEGHLAEIGEFVDDDVTPMAVLRATRRRLPALEGLGESGNRKTEPAPVCPRILVRDHDEIFAAAERGLFEVDAVSAQHLLICGLSIQVVSRSMLLKTPDRSLSSRLMMPRNPRATVPSPRSESM